MMAGLLTLLGTLMLFVAVSSENLTFMTVGSLIGLAVMALGVYSGKFYDD